MKKLREAYGNQILATDERLIICIQSPDVYIYAKKNTPGWTIREYNLVISAKTYGEAVEIMRKGGHMPMSDGHLLNNIEGLNIGGNEQGSLNYAIMLLQGTIQEPGYGSNPGNISLSQLTDVPADLVNDHNLK